MALLNDGASSAPAGTPQLSSILAGYATRPGWSVAGVDYHVGTPDAAVLKDPSTIAIAGVRVDAASHSVSVTGSNVSLGGFDFSKNGGWQVSVETGATNLTIRNSYFKVGSNDLMPIQAYYGGYVSLLNNTFDGGGASRSANAMFFAGAGATIQYNRFTNVPNDAIDITQKGDYSIKYNVFDSLNDGTDYHTDAIQTYFSDIDSLDIQYNTLYQPKSLTASMNSFVRIGDEQGHTVKNPVIAHNTIVAAGGAMANVFDISAGDGVNGSAVLNPSIHDNYIDPTGVTYGIYGPYASQLINPNIYNNTNLTGNGSAKLLASQYNSQWAGIPGSAPAAPVIASSAVVNSDERVLQGTGVAGTTIDVLDGGTLIGTTKAGTSGAWSFTTGHLAAGAHTFTATATDVLGNTSVASAALSTGASATPAPPTPTPTPVATAPVVAVALASDTGASASDKVTATPTLKGTGTPGAVVHLTIDGKAVSQTATADSTGAWTLAPAALADGKHTITASQTNTAGLTGTSSALAFTLDRVAPAVVIASPGGTTTQAPLTVSGTAGVDNAGLQVALFDAGKQVATTAVKSDGTWSTGLTLTTGANALTAKVTDLAGNVGTSAPVSYTLTAAPVSTPPVTTPPISKPPVSKPPTPPAPVVSVALTSDTGQSSTDHVTSNDALQGTGLANTAVHFTMDGKPIAATVQTDAKGAWSFTPPGLADGSHTVIASQTNSAGATGQASLAFTLDTKAAAMTASLLRDTGASSSDNITSNPTVTGTGDANAVVSFKIDHHAVQTTVTADSTGHWTFTPVGLLDGDHRIVARETDSTGHRSSVSLSFNLQTSSADAAVQSFSGAGSSSTTAAALSGVGHTTTDLQMKGHGADGTVGHHHFGHHHDGMLAFSDR